MDSALQCYLFMLIGKADCTVTMTDSNFVQLVSGKLNPQMVSIVQNLVVIITNDEIDLTMNYLRYCNNSHLGFYGRKAKNIWQYGFGYEITACIVSRGT